MGKTGNTGQSGKASGSSSGRQQRQAIGMGCLFLICFLIFVAIWKFWELVALPTIRYVWDHRIMPVVHHFQDNWLMYLVGLVFAAISSAIIWRRYVVPRPRRED